MARRSQVAMAPGGLAALTRLFLVLFLVKFYSAASSLGHATNVHFRTSDSKVSGDLFITEQATLKVQNLRYRGTEPSQWWGVLISTEEVLLSEFTLDTSLDGTPEVTMELLDPMQWNDLDLIQLRSTKDGSLLASATVRTRPDGTGLNAERRRLQASCDADCRIEFGGSLVQYCSCTELSKDPQSLFTVYWNATEGTGSNKVVHFAIAAASKGWAGLGFTTSADTMVGSNAVVVRRNESAPSGATFAGAFYLGGEALSAFRPSNALVVSEVQAEDEDGTLKLQFEAPQSKDVQFSNGPLNVIWAMGELSNEVPQEHYTKGSADLELTAATVTSKADDSVAQPPARSAESSQAPCDSDCKVEFEGESVQYCSCRELSKEPMYMVYWNATDGTGDEEVLPLAISVKSTGWAGLGFTTDRNTMIGSTAVFVGVNDTSSTGASFGGPTYLGGEALAAFRPSNDLAWKNVQSEAEDGTLKLRFEVQQSKAVKLSNALLNVIWAIGDYEGEVPQQHSSKGGADLQLLATTDSMAPAAAPEAAVAPAPSEEEPSSTAAGKEVKDECLVNLVGGPRKYDRCSSISSSPFYLHWKVPANGGTVLEGAMEYTGSGWGAIGWPTTPGQMVGGSAIIVSENTSSPTGAFAEGYYLGSQSVSGVQPPPKFSIIAISAGSNSKGLVVAFRIDLAGLVPSLSGSVPMIYAWGNTNGDSLSAHPLIQSGGASVDYLNGGYVAGNSAEASTIIKIHAWFMAASYGFLFPIGIGIARTMKTFDPFWFYAHVLIQSFGYLLGLAGWILGWIEGGTDSPYGLHRGLGIAVMTLFTLQPSALFLRPKLDSKFRRAWNLVHWWLGRVGLGLAIWNIYEGLINVYPASTTGYVIAYSIVLGVVVGGFLAYEAIRYILLPPPGAPTDSKYRVPEDVGGQFIASAPTRMERLESGKAPANASSLPDMP